MLLSNDFVVRISKSKIAGSVRGLVSDSKGISNQLEAIRRLVKLLEEARLTLERC